MSTIAERILADLATVERLRADRATQPSLARRVMALKTYQARRFERTYADLLANPRYCAASRFFLDELYGPREFAARDAQFARIVPKMVRLFTSEIADTVAALAQLHALSETLDNAMAGHLPDDTVQALPYVQAWQRVGQPDARTRQVALTMQVGQSLDRYTRRPLLRGALHMMRKPAHAAGLGDLQQFLESGFDTFGEMKGAREFLDTVRSRENGLIAALFAADTTGALPLLP